MGVIVDGFAVAFPGVPGGAGAAIKAARTADKATDALRAAGKIDDVSKTSRAARREVMREQGIPTSQQPKSQSKNASGREYRYEMPIEYGKKKEKSVQQQTLDRSHENSPHWEAADVKVDDHGETQMNSYGRPKLDSKKSKRYYEPE